MADRRELPTDPSILKTLTLGDLVRRYRDNVTGKKRTAENETIIVNAFLKHSICKKKLSTLTTMDFARYQEERLQHVKPQSVNRELNPIRHMFRIAQSEWDIPIDNLLANSRFKKCDVRRERRLREGEWELLMEQGRSCRKPIVHSVVQFALETAMRRGEILNLKWEHLNRRDSSLLIPITKNGHSRIIPMTDKAWSILDVVEQADERVFPLTKNVLAHVWIEITNQAGIEDLHFHDLRHEAISRLFEKGLTTPEVALISGHRDMKMLFRYAHAQRSQIISKLKKFEDIKK
ncbi:MAG: tyrosine-type recombinase/integrase [Methyloligellaceae bacterium]